MKKFSNVLVAISAALGLALLGATAQAQTRRQSRHLLRPLHTPRIF